jgi:hypothetical protein
VLERFLPRVADKWDEMPWWEQYTYIEGLRAEGIIQSDQDGSDGAQELQSTGVKVRAIEGKADWVDGV